MINTLLEKHAPAHRDILLENFNYLLGYFVADLKLFWSESAHQRNSTSNGNDLNFHVRFLNKYFTFFCFRKFCTNLSKKS